MLATTISDSGGFEGSQQTLMLESNGGGVIEYQYEHFTIPDNFILRYEGRNLLETGFVGGNRSGTVNVPAGNSNEVEVIVATNDEGTAWNYTVTAQACGDTGNFLIELVGESFMPMQDADGNLKCVGMGTVYIGRSDGIARMLRVTNATVEYDREAFTVSGTVFSEIGPAQARSNALFTGNFRIPFATGTSTSFSDTGSGTGEFQLAERDVEFSTLTITNNGLALTPHFTLPEDLGVPEFLLTGPEGLVISQNILRLAPSFRLSFPNFENITLFGFLSVKEFSDASISYDGTEDTLRLQVKLKIDVLPSDSSRGDLTFNLAGANYIQIKGEEVDVRGELVAQTGLRFGRTRWGVDNIKLTVDTIQGDVAGSAEFVLGPRLAILAERKAEVTVGFKIQPLELNRVAIDVDNLNWPFAPWPLAFWQGFTASLDNIAQSDLDSLEYSGGLKATLGPRLTIPEWLPFGGNDVALISVDASGAVNDDRFIGTGNYNVIHPNVLKGSGSVTFDWTNSLITLTGTKDFLSGFVTTTDTFRVSTRNYGITASGQAAVGIPSFVPWFGGTRLASASYMASVHGSNDDFVAGWGIVHIERLGLNLQFVLGAKCFISTFECERIGSRNIPPTGSFEVEAGEPWVILAANWENATQDDVALEVIRPDGTVIPESEFAANDIAVVDELSNDNSKAVLVASPTSGIWDVRVADGTGLGEVTYFAAAESTGATIHLDAPPSSTAEGDYVIEYEANNADSDTRVSFFYDTDDSGFDGILIGEQTAASSGPGSFVWNTAGVPAGEYHVYAMIFDGENPPTLDYAPGTVQISDGADLSVTMTSDVESIPAGGTADYAIDVTNQSGRRAESVIAKLSLPEGATILDGSENLVDVTDNVATFEVSDLSAGESMGWTVRVSAPADFGSLVTRVHVQSETHDPVLDNNAAEVTTLIESVPAVFPDLDIEWSGDATMVDLGDPINYSLAVTNNGTGAATGVVLTEFFPSSTSYVSAQSTQGTVSYDGFNHRATVNIGDIGVGETVSVTITLDTLAAGDLTSTTMVTSNEEDLAVVDNFLIQVNSVNTAVPMPADLQIDVTADNTTPTVGDQVRITATISNSGPGIASGVHVAASLPPNLEFVSAFPEQGTFDSATGNWNVGNVRDNLSRQLVIVANVLEGGDFDYSFEIIRVNEVDPDSTPGNGQLMEDDTAIISFEVGLPQVLMTVNGSVRVAGKRVRDEDIVGFDGERVRMFFDGSDVGLAPVGIDGFHVLGDQEVLLSFTSPRRLPGIRQRVEANDIVRFTATQLGNTTEGSFALYFDSSDVEFDSGDVYDFTVRDDGSILFAVASRFRLDSIEAEAGDLLAFVPSSLGDTTAGVWQVVLDGSDVGLSQSIDALTIEDDGHLYLSTRRRVTVNGQQYRDVDVLEFEPSSLGAETSGTLTVLDLFEDHAVADRIRDIRAIDFARLTEVPNIAPIAHDDAFSVTEVGALEGNVLAPEAGMADGDDDGDPLEVVAVNGQATAVGTATRLPSGAMLTLNADGQFLYDPQGNFDFLALGESATDSFTYAIDDRYGGSDTAEVHVTIYGISDTTQPVMYFSGTIRDMVGGIVADDEDVVRFDGASYSIWFDGSDMGLEDLKIDALAVLSDQEVLLSFQTAAHLPGISKKVDDADIVRFVASQMGPDTSGMFEMYFDGSDVGLSGEDIDGLDVLPDGRLLISTAGPFRTSGMLFRDEDIAAFTATSLGETTSGTWSLYFDGSDISLREDIDAIATDGQGRVLLSTRGKFSVDDIRGRDRDIFAFVPHSLGDHTTGSYAEVLVGQSNLLHGAVKDVNALALRVDEPNAVAAPLSYAVVSWHNRIKPPDVNGDAAVSPLDAMLVINELRDRAFSEAFTGSLATRLPIGARSERDAMHFLDVNGDGRISPLDAMRVINELMTPGLDEAIDELVGDEQIAAAQAF